MHSPYETHKTALFLPKNSSHAGYSSRFEIKNGTNAIYKKIIILKRTRPRKCLGWETPFEVFAEMIGEDCVLNGSIALMG